MRTTINAKPAEWTESIVDKWNSVWEGELSEEKDSVTFANYFTPRPYVNEWDTGSDTEGFVFMLSKKPGVWRVDYKTVATS